MSEAAGTLSVVDPCTEAGAGLYVIPDVAPDTMTRDIRSVAIITNRPGEYCSVNDASNEEWLRSVDTVASFLQDVLSIEDEKGAERSDVGELFGTAFNWLEASLEPITAKWLRHYQPNSRMSIDDMKQVVREGLIQKLIPSFDPDKASFVGHYASNGWQGLAEYVDRNAASLSTPAHFLKRSSESDRQFAMSVTPYDELRSAVTTDPTDRLASHMLLRLLTDTIATELTALEKAAVVTVRVNDEPYQQVMDGHSVSFRAVDNALQRGMRKLRKALQASEPTTTG